MLTPTREASACYPSSGSRLRRARAVLLFALGTAAVIATRIAIEKSRSVMEALVEASARSATRPHEGRLPGPFPYRPYAPPSRSAAASRVGSTIRQIQIENVADARIRALTGLLLNDTDAVVEILEERLRDTTGHENLLDAMHSTADTELLNQLAVAYLSSSEDEPQHTLLALEAMERASQLEGTERVEIAWNRALALQRFGLHDEARAAWQHYVDIDSSSPWSTEARSHAQSLVDPGHARTREELLVAIKHSVAAGDGAALRRLIVEDQEQFRIVNEEEVLPGAAAELPTHGQSWRVARAAATELTARGDPLLADTLDSLDRSNASSLLMAVRALNDYRRGRIAMSAGNLGIAFEALSAATTALERAGIPFASRAAIYRSTVRIYDGKPEEAVRLIDNAIASVSQLERWPLLGAQLYWVRGLGLAHLGNSGAALRAYERAARFVRRTHEDASRAGLEQVTADALRDVSNLSEAWRHHLNAVASLSTVVRDERKLLVLNGAARAASLDRYLLVAALVHPKALELARTVNDPLFLCNALTIGSQIALDRGDAPMAGQLLQEAEGVCPKIHESGMRARARADLEVMGFRAMEAAGREPDVSALTRSIETFENIKIRTRLAELHLLRARTYLHRGDRAAARLDLQRGIEELDRQRSDLTDDDKRTHASVSAALLDEWTLLELDGGDIEAAFDVAERGRARVILERVTGKSGSAQALPWREVRLRLPNDAALVAFSLVRDRLVIWRGTKDGLRATQKPADPVMVRSSIGRLRRAMEKDLPSVAGQSADLYELLCAPSLGGDARRVVLIPDSELFDVPYAALREGSGGPYLIERYVLTIAPSASLAALQNRPRTDRASRALIMAVSRRNDAVALPGVREEARVIAAHATNPVVLLDDAVTLAALKANAPAIDQIHFAGHAIANPAQPARSALLFGGDETLSAARVSAMDLSGVRLVVLSACQTADRSSDAEAPLTMATAFLTAGTPAVVATTMDIDDSAATRLFDAVYRDDENGKTADEALRDAQLELLHDSRYSAPRYWGPFVTIGTSLATRAN